MINHYKFKNHTLFSTSFHKINQEDQRSDETELFINLNINQNLTASNIDNNIVKSQLEHQVQIQKTKESVWIFDKTNSMKIRYSKTSELNG